MCQSRKETAALPAASGREGGCACKASDDRIVEASHDLNFPEIPLPSGRILEVVGESGLRGLVRRHHDLLRASELGELLPADDGQYAAAVGHIADFVVECCGGPARYSFVRGKGCMRTRHFPFVIDESSRDVWLQCLWQALEEAEFPIEVQREYWNWMEPFSIRMINRRTQRGQPRRYPFDDVLAAMKRRRLFAVCPR